LDARLSHGFADLQSGYPADATSKETTVALDPAELRRMTDEELIQAYREAKTETGGGDPELTPAEDGPVSAIREEMERRGLAPDREDMVPGVEDPYDEPVVEDHA
jgi:hypothetical protein